MRRKLPRSRLDRPLWSNHIPAWLGTLNGPIADFLCIRHFTHAIQTGLLQAITPDLRIHAVIHRPRRVLRLACAILIARTQICVMNASCRKRERESNQQRKQLHFVFPFNENQSYEKARVENHPRRVIVKVGKPYLPPSVCHAWWISSESSSCRTVFAGLGAGSDLVG